MRHGLTLALSLLIVGCAQPTCDPEDKVVRWKDADGDGFGLSGDTVKMCPGEFKKTAARADDCDDNDAAINPWATEACNGFDDDCDGRVDERFMTQTWYPDGDGDGYGADLNPIESCLAPPDHVPNSVDCDDTDLDINPLGTEVCDGNDNDCDGLIDDDDDTLDPASRTSWWHDGDADGYGDVNDERPRCVQPPNTVNNPDDCNDARAIVNPGSVEICNGFDDNCDGLSDDDDPGLDTTTERTWYADTDLDGWGDPTSSTQSCASPGNFQLNDLDCDDNDDQVGQAPRWMLDNDGDGAGVQPPIFSCVPLQFHVSPENGEDCDDNDPNVFPAQLEICDGTDNNCNGRIDDNDPNLSDFNTDNYFADRDGDGFGDPLSFEQRCTPRANAVLDNLDCDDEDDEVHPGVIEVCDFVDNDCNGAVDDDDALVDPNSFAIWYADIDADGFGDLFNGTASCQPPAGFVADATDCLDSNPFIGAPALWHEDLDGDGFGAGPIAGPSCVPPGPTYVQNIAVDCDDSFDQIYPGAIDVCEDGIDADCDGQDLCILPSDCSGYLDRDPFATSGIYTIEPIPGIVFRDVYCDMDTDGGGWTLVSSSTTTVNDQQSIFSTTLETLEPTGTMTGVWSGLRAPMTVKTDIRFTCKLAPTDPAMTVDLSFYEVDWYREMTTGSDSASCFTNIAGIGQAFPGRRNNITGDELFAGDPFGTGVLSGEDFCSDPNDFTVDFDDRGVNGNPNDGTDWGEDDGVPKCGTNNAGGAWFIFIRP